MCRYIINNFDHSGTLVLIDHGMVWQVVGFSPGPTVESLTHSLFEWWSHTPSTTAQPSTTQTVVVLPLWKWNLVSAVSYLQGTSNCSATRSVFTSSIPSSLLVTPSTRKTCRFTRLTVDFSSSAAQRAPTLMWSWWRRAHYLLTQPLLSQNRRLRSATQLRGQKSNLERWLCILLQAVTAGDITGSQMWGTTNASRFWQPSGLVWTERCITSSCLAFHLTLFTAHREGKVVLYSLCQVRLLTPPDREVSFELIISTIVVCRGIVLSSMWQSGRWLLFGSERRSVGVCFSCSVRGLVMNTIKVAPSLVEECCDGSWEFLSLAATDARVVGPLAITAPTLGMTITTEVSDP